MGKVAAMAALLDCTDERIDRIRAFAGIEGDLFVDAQTAKALADAPQPSVDHCAQSASIAKAYPAQDRRAMLEQYCIDQCLAASTREELEEAKRLAEILYDANMIKLKTSQFFLC